MYTRPPERARHKVSLPENYSGNAFQRDGSPIDMPPPVRPPLPHRDREEPILSPPPMPLSPSTDLPASLLSEASEEVTIVNEEKADRDRPALPLPVGIKALDGHFPFGHGIGSEELLIMAVMLMIFLSDREQDKQNDTDLELLAMLGLLLFAG